MQIIEGTLTMTQAVDIIRKETGAHFVEPITERQGDETYTHFRVQHAVATQPGPVVINFNRYDLDTYVERFNDPTDLRIALRSGVRGMTEETVRSRPVAALLRFKQPADLLDLARDCLTLAAEGYEAMGEVHIPKAVREAADQWPLAARNHPQPDEPARSISSMAAGSLACP